MRIPVDDTDEERQKMDESTGDAETFNGCAGKVTIKTKFNHEGEYDLIEVTVRRNSLLPTQAKYTVLGTVPEILL